MDDVFLIFDPRDERFKSPFGAIKSGTVLGLTVYIRESEDVTGVRTVFLYDRHKEPAFYEMTAGEGGEIEGYIPYTASFPVYDTGLYWYHFEISRGDEQIRAGRDENGTRPAVGSASDWQQTVYSRRYPEVEWLKGGVIYHIFVDRFCRGGESAAGEGKVFRNDWGGTPEYRPHNGRIMNNDFFGGDLKGIENKLKYLKELGVTCIYLSPVFEAFSNHKYDTADYTKIDPGFGTEEDFTELCAEAARAGIRVICDGVFAHTGSDSVYFDKYGRYGGGGAYANPGSKYRSWYFFDENENYLTWWGIDTLPRLNKEDPGYIEFITGTDGIVRRWLRAGASGWRLDVADELPSEFIAELTAAAKEEKDDALILGEVWEDASSKVSYGERKNYFEGDKLDSVTDYPLRNGIIAFVRDGDPVSIADTVERLTENYPKEVINLLMNVLGTHDTERIITVLAGKQIEYEPSRENEAVTRMTEEEWEMGTKRLRIAAALQMTLPGVPCIYYGDEAGMEGYRDPFNRCCYPWGHEKTEILEWYRKLISIRRSHRVYADGGYRTRAAHGGLFAFERYDFVSGGTARCLSVITAANCGKHAEDLEIAGRWCDLISGREFCGGVKLAPLEVMILKQKR